MADMKPAKLTCEMSGLKDFSVSVGAVHDGKLHQLPFLQIIFPIRLKYKRPSNMTANGKPFVHHTIATALSFFTPCTPAAGLTVTHE